MQQSFNVVIRFNHTYRVTLIVAHGPFDLGQTDQFHSEYTDISNHRRHKSLHTSGSDGTDSKANWLSLKPVAFSTHCWSKVLPMSDGLAVGLFTLLFI